MNCLVACSSDYSFYQSCLNINEIVKFSYDNNYQSVLLADYKNFYGLFPFINSCQKYKLTPIIGYYFDCEDGRFFVVCKNMSGYLNSINFLNQPLSLDNYINYQEGNYLIMLVDSNIHLNNFLDCNDEFIKYFKDLKNKIKDLYCGVSLIQTSPFKKAITHFNNILDKDLIAFNHFISKNETDIDILKMLEAIENNYSFNDLRIKNKLHRSLLSYDQYFELYGDLAIKSNNLFSQCKLDFSKLKTELPKPRIKFVGDSDIILKQLSIAGLKKRFNNQISSFYVDRLEYELETIIKLGFSSYFLIVYDIVKFASSKGILKSLGRGSACGSLVAYSLGIIDVDPIKYNLLFERFLNSDRVTVPDIDLDFDASRRDEIINYLFDTYGYNHVAYLSTFVYFKNNKTIVDVAKSLGVNDKQINKILKCMNFNCSIKENIQHNKQLQNLCLNNSILEKTLFFASKLEGLIRQNSIHPAGVVLSNDNLNNLVADHIVDDKYKCLMLSKDDIGQLGLIKIDCLSLKNLTFLNNVLNFVKINLNSIPLNDKKTFELLSSGNTLSIFQFETPNFKRLLTILKPKNIDELINLNALNRPIAKKYVQPYINNIRSQNWIKSLNPIVYNIIKSTNGILLFEEQMMEICRQYAHFSLKDADSFRIALKKQQLSLIADYKQKFLNNTNQDIKTLNSIIEFSQYSFNRSHAVAYTILAYKMAYLKANYPLEYYLVAFNFHNKIDLLKEMHLNKIVVLKPSILGNINNIIQDNKLVLGLNMIKGISSNILDKIILIQSQLKNKIDYFYWITLLFSIKLSKEDITLLINSGSMDILNLSRYTMLLNLDNAFQYSRIVTIMNDKTTVFNFDLVSKPILKIVKDDPIIKAKNERQVLGVYLSYHPIKLIRSRLNIDVFSHENTNGVCLLLFNDLKIVKTKKNVEMAFVECEDEYEKYELVIFNKIYEQIKNILFVDKIYKVLVKRETNNKLICLDLESVDQE